MNIEEIRDLVKDGHSVVIVEEGRTPLVVTELKPSHPVAQEIPISSRWPKPTARPSAPGQDQILERLNKEILALKTQIEQEEQGSQG
jgi:hypothetical protein